MTPGRARVGCALVALATCALASPVDAQVREHAYVQGIAGSTFGRITGSVFGAAAGVRVADHLEVTGEIGYLHDALSKTLERDLDAAEQRITSSVAAQFGRAFAVDFDARAPVWYGLGGVRYLLRPAGRIRPFAEGSIGMARIEPRVRLSVNGEDLSGEVSHLVSEAEDQSHVAAGVAGGVVVGLFGPVRAEFAYRYLRVLADDAIDINRIHAAVGLRF